MTYPNINKLIEIEGLLFDELMRQGKSDEAITVIRRQFVLLEHSLAKKRRLHRILDTESVDLVV